MINLYHILEIEQGATVAEIKKAFRQKAKQYHPDMNPSVEAKERFRQVYAAYEILGDDSKRILYNNLLHDAPHEKTASEHSQERQSQASYAEPEVVRTWTRQSYRQADNYSNMSYRDFRRQKVHIHQWSKYLLVEWLVTFIFLGLLALSIWLLRDTLLHEKDHKIMESKVGLYGFGIFASLFVLGHSIAVRVNNFLIDRD